MKIPKEFKLYGKTIKVKYSENLLEVGGRDGEADYTKQEIRLYKYKEGTNSKQYEEQLFLHELVHQILYHAQIKDINNDENKVEQLSELLYQALTTMEY